MTHQPPGSETPETDAFEFEIQTSPSDGESRVASAFKFARKLERERNAAITALGKTNRVLVRFIAASDDEVKRLTEKLDKANAELTESRRELDGVRKEYANLAVYTDHLPSCAVNFEPQEYLGEVIPQECTCGLSELLK